MPPPRGNTVESIASAADDYDHLHSIHAALSSLGAAAASFDATMDSLSITSARQRKRVENLELRTVRLREALRCLNDMVSESSSGEVKDSSDEEENLQSSKSSSILDDGKSRYMKLHCPSTYEEALRGMKNKLSDIRIVMSSRDSVRSAANDAIRQVLTKDMNSDDGLAIPSDAWLDHASSGFDVERAVEHTNEMRNIPLILGENNDILGKGSESNYQRILETLALNALNKIDGLDRLDETRSSSKGGGGGDDEQTVHTTTSQTSHMSMASSGTRMTAGQRRRWHKQQQHQHQQQQMQMMMQGTSSLLAPHLEEANVKFVAGRQQSHMCSQPYLCEVFHDSHGIGMAPPRGLVDCPGYSSTRTQGGTEFYPPVSNITDLHVFNTARNSYGGAAVTITTKKEDWSGI